MTTTFVHGLIELEKFCLLRLSEAARGDGQIQIALNAIVRAQRLEKEMSFNVSQEFANVLWFQKEEKLAIEFLNSLLDNDAHLNAVDIVHRACLLAQLVSRE
jgi:serine-protein kinase ATM